MLTSVSDWINEVSGENWTWYVKRLSGNDTLANGTHQAGPYVPRDFILSVFPSMKGRYDENQERWFDLAIDSHDDVRQVRAIWYNNKFRGRTRNEARLTNFGGGDSPLLDPDSTGALTIFAFERDDKGETLGCRVWISRHETEEDVIEEKIGPVEPGTYRIWPGYGSVAEPATDHRHPCRLKPDEIPPVWIEKFPSGQDIISKTIEICAVGGLEPDSRLMKRRVCEYELFQSVEEAIELPVVTQGFASIEEFVSRAQSILQRRKARSGRSLELHAKEIFVEEGLTEDVDFSHQPTSELGKKPDFLFPSEENYQNPAFSSGKLRMLAVKTTCRDRWRQVLNEADRIPEKHLLTLQEGISENQFREMQQENVRLVVPATVIPCYSRAIQPHLQTLENFIGELRLLSQSR